MGAFQEVASQVAWLLSAWSLRWVMLERAFLVWHLSEAYLGVADQVMDWALLLYCYEVLHLVHLEQGPAWGHVVTSYLVPPGEFP